MVWELLNLHISLEQLFTIENIMAKVQLSALVSQVSGKLNGSVFARNKGGQVLRTKVTPINPSTPHQTAQRAIVSDLSKAWTNTLTDAQRAAWKAFGQVIGQKNIFGNNLILSGMATFQRINIIIITAGGTQVNAPPSDQNVVAMLTLALTANHTGPALTIAFTPTPLVAPQGAYIFATPAMSAGISNVSNKLRFISYVSAMASGASILTAWQNRFGTFPAAAGPRISVSVNVVSTTTGAVSAAAGATTIVV